MLLIQKIGNWFRYKYHHRPKQKSDVDDVLQTLLKISETRPKRKQDIKRYSELRWNLKVKAGFDALWSGCRSAGVPSKNCISFINKYTKDLWEKEPEELRKSIEQQCDAEYEKAIQEWEGRAEWMASPKSYQT